MTMDSSFTEHILERARERQKKLVPKREANLVITDSISQPNLSESRTDRNLLRKVVVSDSSIPNSVSPRSFTTPDITRQNSRTRILSSCSKSCSTECNNELNIQTKDINMEIKFSSTDNIQLEVEFVSDDSDNSATNFKDSNDTTPALREVAKTRLQRLGKLYAGDEDLSSPIHRTEGKFHIEDNFVTSKEKENNSVDNKPRKGLGKLADLAKDINQWEDDITPRRDIISKDNVPKKSWKPPAPQPPESACSGSVKSAIRSKPPAPKPPTSPKKTNYKQEVTSSSPIKSKTTKINQHKPKQLNWDPSMINSLESQGFTRSTSNSRLVYNYKNSQDNKCSKGNKENVLKVPIKEDQTEAVENHITTKKFIPLNIQKDEDKVTPRSPTKNRSNAIASKAAVFERKIVSSPVKKDPALLSVSERRALFEKAHGDALVPKAAFGMAAPTKSTPKYQILSSASTPSNLSEIARSDTSSESDGVAAKIAQLSKHQSTKSDEQMEHTIKERQKEMEMLMNRFNHNKQVLNKEEDSDSQDENEVTETTAMINSKPTKVVFSKQSPPPPPLPNSEPRRSGEKRTKKSDSPQVKAVLGDIKRIKVSQPKDGELYPCLSDIEATTETEPEPTITPSPNSSFCSVYNSDEENTSFGRKILEAVCNNDSSNKTEISEDNSASEVTDVFEDLDELLNDCDQDTDSIGPSPPKNVKLASPEKSIATSESFNYKSYSPKKIQQSTNQFKSPCKPSTSQRRESEEFPIQVIDGNELLPLTHTVSFYRKQQSQPFTTPVRQIIRQPLIEENESTDITSEKESVAKKICQLMEDVSKQQMTISQTSRALNLCNSTPEFTGSTEQVEAEKVLLLSTHRRQAVTLEIQRLKVEGTLRPILSHAQNVPLEKGSVTISDITLPLKKEYVRALAAAGGKGHHVVCLVKCGEQVMCTQIASTVASSPKDPDLELIIPGQIRLDKIHSDFTITFEVYCLRAQEEVLPHEVKYHINKKGSSKITPKKNKQDSRLVCPPKESPAGPHAVRSPTFALHGYIVFSIQAINKTSLTLNKIPPISPLEGSVSMKIKCELDISVEMRGFLNMFEDVSDFGAWHRRWCLLKGNVISYWKYPEDERKKTPIGTIDLKSCITKTVGPVSRDICARLNTFILEKERPTEPGDRKTLTVECFKDKTLIKYLLSADSKEERIEWCANLNKAMISMRMWGKKSDV